MHWAAALGLADVVSMLVRHGERVTVTNRMGETPLHRYLAIAFLAL